MSRRKASFATGSKSKETSPVKSAATEPVSTFSIDVDTASYAFVRRALNAGRLPPKDSVRVEEFVNYFPYDYPKPESAQTPFKPTITVTPSPWNAGNRLVHVAIQGYALQSAERPRANLVFLIDVSGSMAPQDRLPLVKNALRMLVDELKPEDTVAIVTYASGSGVALEPTKVADKAKILAAHRRARRGRLDRRRARHSGRLPPGRKQFRQDGRQSRHPRHRRRFQRRHHRSERTERASSRESARPASSCRSSASARAITTTR